MKYYIAYGSNLSVSQMNYRCPDAIYVGTGELQDMQLLFRGSQTGSYLTIEKKAGIKVPVLIWQVSDADERSLDIYEGYPKFYRKENLEITVHSLIDGKPIGSVNAFVYIMDYKRPLGIPTLRYFDVCSEGYRRFGFDPKTLEVALRQSQERLEKRK